MSNTKMVSRFATVYIALVLFIYLAFSFVHFNANAETWGSNSRAVFSIFSIGILPFIFMTCISE